MVLLILLISGLFCVKISLYMQYNHAVVHYLNIAGAASVSQKKKSEMKYSVVQNEGQERSGS